MKWIFAVFCLAFIVWSYERLNYDLASRCAYLVGKLNRGRYETITDFVESYRIEDDLAFWEESEALAGLLSSLYQSFILLGIVQLLRHSKVISRGDALYVWGRVCMQVYYTLRSVPGAVMAKLWSGYPHASAFFAWSCRRQIMDRLMTIGIIYDTPSAVAELRNVL